MDNLGGGGGHLHDNYNENSMITSSNANAAVSSSEQQLDNLSNLLINSYEDDAAALDQYESEMEQNLNENLVLEKEQSNQRLFQSFQTSACAVAQMFKDKNTQLSSWESFQNSAGAITVLYKDSLEACRVHMELGVHLGQQRKLKDIINWIKKKKKRSIRKDELISFLIGKQYPSQNQMFNLFNQSNSTTNSANFFNSSSATMNTNSQSAGQLGQQMPHPSAFASHNNRRQQSMIRQQQQPNNRNATSAVSTTNLQSNPSSANNSNSTLTSSSGMNPMASQLNLVSIGDNSNGSNDSHAVETNSDLATFREALIMHNRTRDTPMNRHHSHQHLSSHGHHHHHSQQHHLHLNSQPNPQQSQQQQQALNPNATQPNCDDLDCFFCEQIATHIEHKRSSANINFDMESPTRKRSRFY